MRHTTTGVTEDEQRREHTGLRTADEHYSAREVAWACHCSYGTAADDRDGIREVGR